MNEEQGRWVTIHGKRVFLKTKNAQLKKEVADKLFKKQYTSKDIKKLEGFGGNIRGYKLGRYYLLKQLTPWGNIWWLNNKDKRPQIHERGTYSQMSEYKNVIEVDSYKKGIEKLIELANKK